MLVTPTMIAELDLQRINSAVYFAAFFAEQGLSDRSLIGNNVTIGVAVPGAKDGIRFFLRRFHIAQYDDCANGNLGSIGVGKISAASAVQHLFELGLASH